MKDLRIGFLIRPFHLHQSSPDPHFTCIQPCSISLFHGPSFCSTHGHTPNQVLTNLFFNSSFNPPMSIFFSLLNTLFAISILTRISFSEYPDDERMLPRYLTFF